MRLITKSKLPCHGPENLGLTGPFSVVDNLRLANGVLFPIPVTLDVSRADIERLAIAPGSRITLLDPRDEEALAIVTGVFIVKWNVPMFANAPCS